LNSIAVDVNDKKDELFTFKKYNSNQESLSTSSSLNSSNSFSSSTTKPTSLTTMSPINNGISKGTFTALCFDARSNKLLAAKCDKRIYTNTALIQLKTKSLLDELRQ